MFNKNLRLGAHGILFSQSSLLLVQKTSGPYKGLYDLPGGKIEFSEDPEKALVREIKEEVSLLAGNLKLLNVFSHVGIFKNPTQSICFQHVGIVHLVESFKKIEGQLAEEIYIWKPLKDLVLDELTPIAKSSFLFFKKENERQSIK